MNTTCPHCQVVFHDKPRALSETGKKGVNAPVPSDADGPWTINVQTCRSCERDVIWLLRGRMVPINSLSAGMTTFRPDAQVLLYPRNTTTRSRCAAEVPKVLADDYHEACMVQSASPRASAALSRRCLQLLLREHAQVKPGELSKEIQQVLDSRSLPSLLADSIDAIRSVGNFAAHPMKSTQTGAILAVEPGEVEWLLDTLERLFDFYCVEPARTAARRAALNAKLHAAGKPPLK